MDKIDFKKTDRALYSGKQGRFDLLQIPPLRYLAIDGTGGPFGASYADAVAALYVLSYGLKAMSKKFMSRDYVVAPLEGLWWADDMAAFAARQKALWHWSMMIRQPDWLDPDDIESARNAAIAKQGKLKEPRTNREALELVRTTALDEGTCYQTLHVGSYDDETAVLAELHNQIIPESGYRMRGRHHEIYLSDPRKVAPQKLKTILRQPVARG